MPVAAGPKRHLDQSWDESALPKTGPRRVIAFIESLNGRDGPIKLRKFQKEIIRGLYKRPRPRQAYVQMGRQNGKSALAAWLGLYALVADNARNPVIAIVANSERQAKELFIKAVELYDNTPALRECCMLFSDRLEYRAGGTRLQVFASSPAGSMGGGGRQIRGLSCHMVINDELAFTPDDRLWASVLWPTILADPDGLMLALTTPGWDMQGPAHALYRQAVSGTGDRFYGRIYEATPECAIDDEQEWQRANPALGAGLKLEDLRIAFKNRSSDESFRREHLGQWTHSASAWLSRAAWDACAAPTDVPPGSQVWLGFDGSWSRDSTALVAVTRDSHIKVLGLWESSGRKDYRIPRDEVAASVAAAFQTYSVMQMLCDPAYWESEIAAWAARYGEERVLAFPPTRSRMAPASVAFHGAVSEQRLTHDGDEALTRHVLNCVSKPTAFGDTVTKADKDSPAKIDAAVAAILAFHAASSSFHADAPGFFSFDDLDLEAG